ncbi:MAG: hypothetical protein V3U84_10745 [Thiotrichaceae bacterium]
MADPPHSEKGFLLGIFADVKPLISAFAREFLIADDVTEREKLSQGAFEQRQYEIKLSDDVLTREQVSRPINKSRSSLITKAEQKLKAKKFNDFIFRTLLAQMRERITELETQMAKRFEALRGKYGDNVIGGMASAFLSDEKLAELESDEQRLRALAEQFLDENGEIKDRYKNLEEAKYVRDWVELQTLKPVVAKYDGRDTLTADEELEIQDAADKASLADNTNKITLSGNDGYQNTVDKTLDDDRWSQESIDTNTNFTFR